MVPGYLQTLRISGVFTCLLDVFTLYLGLGLP
jgi:hypothetical protein